MKFTMCNSEKENKSNENVTIIRINNEEEFQKFKAIYQSGYSTGIIRGITVGIVFGCIGLKLIESLIHFIVSLI